MLRDAGLLAMAARGVACAKWCEANDVELAFTPAYGSSANPIEAHFGPLRQFVINKPPPHDH